MIRKLVMLTAVLAAASCHRAAGLGPDAGTDADGDADADSDGDTDTDADADADADSDADTDTDTDADTDTDGDGDGDADADCSEGWCVVSAGSFFMGSPEDEYGRDNDEVLHEVTLTRSFLLKQTEVTQEEWFQSMGTNSSYFPGCGDSCPVENLNWYEAVAYCNALSLSKSLETCYKDPDDSTNYDIEDAIGFKEPSWPQGLDCEGYRLPTEAEWEYAARAGTITAFYTGNVLAESFSCEADANLDPAAWYCANSEGTTHLVGQRLASDWGLHDMLGNVWEWVWDWYDVYDSGSADPLGPETGQWRVFRGGSYHHSSKSCRAAGRGMAWPGTHDTNPLLGLRPARTIP